METKDDKKDLDDKLKKTHLSAESKKKEENEAKKDQTAEEKLKNTEEKLLRTLAELENQRRRFEKETKEAFEYGGFNFAREILTLLDNLQRAQTSIKNDEVLKKK